MSISFNISLSVITLRHSLWSMPNVDAEKIIQNDIIQAFRVVGGKPTKTIIEKI